MSTRYGMPKQVIPPVNPVFHSDAHALFLLTVSDVRYARVYTRREIDGSTRYTFGTASKRRLKHDQSVSSRFWKPAYRIVVRLKTPVSADAPVKQGEPA